MAPQHWQLVKEILGEALEHKQGEDRRIFVAEKCGNDPTLQREVETYLNISNEKMEACAENMRDNMLSKMWSQPIGRRIGAYRIVQEIGRGGMGAVFLAARADGEFEKEVAIKLLKRGTDTDEIVRRFRAERQILARLEHQGIARLLDAGTTEDGLPYFVMEYVAGVPVTQFVQQHRLSIRQRLELFLNVCSAVERAHRDHIVHRDIKPGNILVTSDGEPKLLDFGIAKLLEAGESMVEATATSQQRLTPICASPEQARGEPVTMASDIYALGALLYEMLTQRSPHQFSSTRPSPEELARVVCEEDVLPPSAVVAERSTQQQLQGDLDNITLHAMRKEPERRYHSVSGFAEDVRRYLHGQPIEARPNTAVYRVQRFLARRGVGLRTAVAAAVVLLLLCGALFFVSSKLHRASGTSARQSVKPIDGKSIAVLPFDTFDNAKDNRYFVDGMQDDILTDLAKVSDLKVISRSGVEHYRGATKDAREIGRSLGVARVLEGSVQRSGERVRVNVRLVDTATNTQVWSEHYERTVNDLFALQSELAQSIVAQLQATLSPSEKAAIERQPTQNMEAYDLYLRARDLTSKPGMNWATKKKGVDLLDQATAKDPQFTLAYCLAAETNVLIYRYNDHTPERLARAKEAAAKALELAPDLGDAHLAQALYYYHGLRDYAGAQRELDLAAPTLSGKTEFLLPKQIVERRFGHWKDAVRDGEKAVSLNPRDPNLAGVLIETYRALRMYSEGEELADETIAKLPASAAENLWAYKCDFAFAQGDLKKVRDVVEAGPGQSEWKTSMLGMIEFYRRNYAEASRIMASIPSTREEPFIALALADMQRLSGNSQGARIAFERARETMEKDISRRPNDPIAFGYLAFAFAGLGQKKEALDAIHRAAALAPIAQDAVDGANWMGAQAGVYAMMGESDLALEQLAKVVKLPNGISYGDLLLNPDWDPIRKDPRFEQALAQALKPPVYN